MKATQKLKLMMFVAKYRTHIIITAAVIAAVLVYVLILR